MVDSIFSIYSNVAHVLYKCSNVMPHLCNTTFLQKEATQYSVNGNKTYIVFFFFSSSFSSLTDYFRFRMFILFPFFFLFDFLFFFVLFSRSRKDVSFNKCYFGSQK